MKFFSSNLVLIYLGLSLLAFTANANPARPLTCKVGNSDDQFRVYPRQISYTSKSFIHYQLIDGLTLVIVNRQTLRFNRLSNLNLLPHSTLDPSLPAEPVQFFSGICHVHLSP